MSNGQINQPKVICYAQWIATFAIMFLMTQPGFYLGWSSPNHARLGKNKTEEGGAGWSVEEVAWLSGTSAYGGIPGAIIGPVLVECIGPKNMGLMTFGFASISWLLIWMSGDAFWWLFTGRFLGGLMMNMAFTCIAMFLGEVSGPKRRGTLISIAVTGNQIGKVIGSYLESYSSKHISCPVYMTLCVVGLVLLMYLRDSPYYRMKLNDIDGTRKSIRMYFPNSNVDDKLQDVRNYVEDQSRYGIRDKLKMFKSKSVQKSLLLILLLYTLTQATGVMVLIQHLQQIIEQSKSEFIDAKQFFIFTNFLNLATRFITFNVFDVFGRRIVLMTASILSSVSLGALGVHFYLVSLGFNIEVIKWLPFLVIIVFKLSYTVGFYTGLSAVLSEIFPSNVKGIAVCAAHLMSALANSVILTSFLPMSDLLGIHTVFWIYAGFAFLITPSVLFLLPETMGKTLEEIQEIQQMK